MNLGDYIETQRREPLVNPVPQRVPKKTEPERAPALPEREKVEV
jgi:hypothetical protein